MAESGQSDRMNWGTTSDVRHLLAFHRRYQIECDLCSGTGKKPDGNYCVRCEGMGTLEQTDE